MTYLERAEEIKDDLIYVRRKIHEYPELGFDLDRTIALVTEKLEEYGIEYRRLGKAGIEATIGSGSPVILLRGDMDGLPMKEDTGLEFSSKTNATHSCGHDAHTSMLLMAGRLLKENEENLKGTVKLMFQPAEELLAGALDMMDNGILEDPKVDAAVAIHVFVGADNTQSGTVTMSRGQAMASADAYTIYIEGQQTHGSTPEEGVDAVIVACHIAIALQNIISREVSLFDPAVLIVGKIQGGDTVNTTPGDASLEVSFRASNEKTRAFIDKRIREISKGIAQTFRAEAVIQKDEGAPSLNNDEELIDSIFTYTQELIGDKAIIAPMIAGTEDFAFVSQEVPSALLRLGVGSKDEGYTIGLHSPKMVLDEDALTTGVATYAQIATRYLEEHSS